MGATMAHTPSLGQNKWVILERVNRVLSYGMGHRSMRVGSCVMVVTIMATIQRSAQAPGRKSAEKSASESASPDPRAEESAEKVLRFPRLCRSYK